MNDNVSPGSVWLNSDISSNFLTSLVQLWASARRDGEIQVTCLWLMRDIHVSQLCYTSNSNNCSVKLHFKPSSKLWFASKPVFQFLKFTIEIINYYNDVNMSISL